MPSESGSPEPVPRRLGSLAELKDLIAKQQGLFNRLAEGPRTGLTTEEQQAISDGEPYCFRCGRPASSFPEYWEQPTSRADGGTGTEADYVRREEGTYNPETDRFACDACYVAIGMPAGYDGWKAP